LLQATTAERQIALPPELRERTMPIKTHLDGSFLSFDPEAVGVMGVAYEMVRATIQCGYRNTISNEIIANKLSNLPKQVRETPTSFAKKH
jgi:hypothetical protein